MLVVDIAVVVVDIVVVVVVGIVMVGFDIEWNPAFEHSLVDLSRRNLDDSSSLDYKC